MGYSTDRSWAPRQTALAGGVAALHVLVGYVLITGMGTFTPDGPESSALTVIELTPPVEPEPPPETPPPEPRPEPPGGATPAPRIDAPAVLLPAPPAPTPLIVTVPPIPTSGGATDNGTGIGEGGSGGGSGAGVGDGRGFTDARQIRGRFRNSDFPASARSAGRIRIGVRYAVDPTGAVGECEIIDTSGYPEVDAMTCRIIVERYRFRPARDEQGVPVTKVMEEDYTWTLD